jgi:hypothetical protein
MSIAAKLAGKLVGKAKKPKTGGGRRKKIKRSPEAVAKKMQREEAVDLGTPSANVGGGRGMDDVNAGRAGKVAVGKPREAQVAAKQYSDKAKALGRKEKQLANMRAKADSMKDRKKKIEYLAKNKQKMDDLKASISDMKKRGFKAMKYGGSMKKKMMGGGYMKKKMAGGGPLKSVDAKKNPGLAKLPTPVRNKMGFAKKGKKVSESMMEDYTSVPKELSAQAQSKKKKKMGGGKVYKRKHSGKVIKNNMSGQDLVNACYD